MDNDTAFIMVSNDNMDSMRRDREKDHLTIDDISTMFDDFLAQFARMEKSGKATTQMFLNAVEEITEAVLWIKPVKLLHPKLVHHPLMKFLHQMLVDILYNWRATDARLNIQESDIFLKIVLLFVRAAEQADIDNSIQERKRIEDLLATKRFLLLVREQVNDNIINKEGVNDDPNICTLGLLTINLLKGCPFYYTTEKNTRLINDLVMNCLDSYDYMHSVHQLQRDETLTEIDQFLLYKCWEYVPFGSVTPPDLSKPEQAEAIVQHVYDELLTRFERALARPPPITPSSIHYILQRCSQLLHIHNLSSFHRHAPYIIDYLTTILNKSASSTSHNTSTDDQQALLTIALEAFASLSKNSDIRIIIKQRQLTPLFTHYTAPNIDQHKRKLAFAILAENMDEEHVTENSGAMMTEFLSQLKQLDPTEYNADADNALASIKALMQHEEMKNEFIKQGGVDQLVTFIRDGDLNKQSPKQLTDAMNILWSCTFHSPDIIDKLKKDAALMSRIHQLHEQNKVHDDTTLEKAAEGLIWKLEKEEQFKQQQEAELQLKKQKKQQKAREGGKDASDGDDDQATEEEEEEEDQYDLMISYSWADMDLAHRIFHHLRDTLGYRIWIDQEQMHGSTIQAMANAVDHSQFVLMCMSDTYKRSANCQSEAEYAFNRKKHIIPLKMKKDYVADGWLGFILGTKMYIDFGNFEFEKAIDLLNHEIKLQKRKRQAAKEAAKAEKMAEAESKQQPQEEEDQESEVKSEPRKRPEKTVDDLIVDWNPKEVMDFLSKHNLIAMIPLCYGINGEDLYALYSMCRNDPNGMFRSLKYELLQGHHRILPIATYLRFLSHMRSVTTLQSPFYTPFIIKDGDQ